MRLPGGNVAFQPPDGQDPIAKKRLKPSLSKAFRSCAYLLEGIEQLQPLQNKECSPKN